MSGEGGSSSGDGHRNVSTAGLLLIAFFWVVGGIYGNEPLVAAGPPAYMLSLLVICAVCYALPMSLISAELACALPYDGGLVAWVDEVCGKTIGGHNAYWLWLSYIFDSCAYPVLGASYVGNIQQFDLSKLGGDRQTGEKIVACIIVAFITAIKLGGTDYIVKASTIFFFFSMTPSVIFMVWGSKDINPEELINTDTGEDVGGYNAAQLFSWVTWLYCGFNSLGALAGEVKDPTKTYPVVIALLIPISLITVAWPLSVAVSIDPNRTNYIPGHFNDLAAQECGEWLRYGFFIGAAFSFVGLYNAQIMVCERSAAAPFEPMIEKYLKGGRRNALTRYLLSENGTGVAPIFIIGNAMLAAVLVWMPYDALIELSMLQMSLNMVLFMYAFLWYKWNRPKMSRPFKIPGGFFGGFLVALPCFGLTAATFYFAAADPEVIFGFTYGKAKGLGAVVVLGLVAHFFIFCYRKCCGPATSSMLQDERTPLLIEDKSEVDGNVQTSGAEFTSQA
mmetsp:Transcript_15452/g.45907  ORF Transcript_15452/g.45907 Transcript_15452/m.45907 type:complete len:505 (+) Transcript_15452:97-1611(+)|eukprot:CAMPEP_0206303902 /NCGR_PEP_ID=MMETSP0106_2-20121207/9473_1 /ASSEMBLY_ACC=CAM_ASM_000206 /TAXON_ID=81532 /ORGANISM="Acanthoeca-like sp., Strain 10tr" /LENGTH=504 /DNA_ID=CAMNT_0053734705 /DNA_START=44 /DNA_END=1558 /DNA_ORIENTATION=-